MVGLSITGKEALFDYIASGIAPDSAGLDKAGLLGDTRVTNDDLKAMVALVSAESERPVRRLHLPTRQQLIDILDELLDIRLGTPGTLLRGSGEVEIQSSSPHAEERGNSGVHVGNRYTSYLIAGSGEVADGELHQLRQEQGWLSIPLDLLMGDSLAWETVDILRYRYIAKLVATHQDPLVASQLCQQNYIADSDVSCDSDAIDLSPQAAQDFQVINSWLREHKNGSIALATVFRCLGIGPTHKKAIKLVDGLREQEIARLTAEQDLHRDEAVHQVDTTYIRAETIDGIREYRIYPNAIRTVEATLRDALHLQPIDPAASAAVEPKAGVKPQAVQASEENTEQWIASVDFAKRHNIGKQSQAYPQVWAAIKALSEKEIARLRKEEKLPKREAIRTSNQTYIAAFGRRYLLSPRAVADVEKAIQPIIDAGKIKWTNMSTLLERWGILHHVDNQRYKETVAVLERLRDDWIDRRASQDRQPREKAMEAANERYIRIEHRADGQRNIAIHPDAMDEVNIAMHKICEGKPAAAYLRLHGISPDSSHAKTTMAAMEAIKGLRGQHIERLMENECLPRPAAEAKTDQDYIGLHDTRLVIRNQAEADVNAALSKIRDQAQDQKEWVSLNTLIKQWQLVTHHQLKQARVVADALVEKEIEQLKLANRKLSRKKAAEQVAETYLSIKETAKGHQYRFSPRAQADFGAAIQELFPQRVPKADTHVGRLKARGADAGANLGL